MTSQSKIPLPNDPGKEQKNVGILAGQYTTSINALHSAGATLETATFIFGNVGIVFTVCQRLIEMRENGIDESVLWGFIENIFN